MGEHDHSAGCLRDPQIPFQGDVTRGNPDQVFLTIASTLLHDVFS
jgi:hypothetical protein